jgi:hypothetical protein
MTLVALLTIAATGKAMSYDQARNEALFLTDKMAYELNLTDAQYEAAYEINLDYLMGVTSYDDVYGTYWERRNLDLSYILLDWQWNAFCAASYFFRPLTWRDGFWHFGVYLRYPHRDHFFFGRPAFYATYRGGHAWHVVGGRGYYHSRSNHFRHASSRPINATYHHRLHGNSMPSHHHSTVTPSRHHSTVTPSQHHSTVTPSQHHSTVTPSQHHSTTTPGHQTQNHQSRPEVNSSLSNHSNHSSANAGGSFGRSHSSGSFGRSGAETSHSSGSFGRSGTGTSHSSGSFNRGGSSSHSSGGGTGRSSSGGRNFGGRR